MSYECTTGTVNPNLPSRACVFGGRCRTVKETPTELKARMKAFGDWIQARPEKNILVVGHSHFFRCLTGKKKLSNCELMKVEVQNLKSKS